MDGNVNRNYRLSPERLYGWRILENHEYRKEELEKRLLLPGDLPAYLSLSLDRKAVHR
jgi:hypothetical protein